MLVIICPNCGPRNSDEFTFGGEVRPRPQVGETDPATWRRYLYMRANVPGWVSERWFHLAGCRRYLMLERHRSTNEIRSVALVGDNR